MGVLPVDEAIERQLLNIIICHRKNQLKDEVRDHTGPHIISITLKKKPETLLLYKRWTAVFCIMKNNVQMQQTDILYPLTFQV